MHPKAYSQAIVRKDPREDWKRRIFQDLNAMAKSNDIAVIYQLIELVRQRDPSVSVQDGFQFQSRGPTGTPGVCVFCGKKLRNSKDFIHLGKFVSDPWCYYDFKQALGVCYLESAGYRPPVIIVQIPFPGSIDNAILDLAWGLAAHRLFGKSYLMAPASLKTNSGAHAVKLVRQTKLHLTLSEKKRVPRLRHAREKAIGLTRPKKYRFDPRLSFDLHN